MTVPIGISMICIFFDFLFWNRSTKCVCVCVGNRLGLFIRSIIIICIHACVCALFYYYDQCVASNICLFHVIFASRSPKWFRNFSAARKISIARIIFVRRWKLLFNGKRKKKTKPNEMRWIWMTRDEKRWNSGINENSCWNCALILHTLFFFQLKLWCRVAYMHVLLQTLCVWFNEFFFDLNKMLFFLTFVCYTNNRTAENEKLYSGGLK